MTDTSGGGTVISPRDPVAWFLRQVADDPEAGRFGPQFAALVGIRGEGLCDCDRYDSPPTDWDDRSLSLLHHNECAAETTARVLAVAYADRDGYLAEWAT